MSHTQKQQAALSHTLNEEVHWKAKKSELEDVRGRPEDVCVCVCFWPNYTFKDIIAQMSSNVFKDVLMANIYKETKLQCNYT